MSKIKVYVNEDVGAIKDDKRKMRKAEQIRKAVYKNKKKNRKKKGCVEGGMNRRRGMDR